MEPRRPLLVSHTAAAGGSNQVLLALLRHRPEEMEPACVFLDDGPALDAARELGVPATVVVAGRAREAWRFPSVVRRLRGAMRSHRADLVFGHVTKAHLYASPAAALEALPYLWWHHELPGQKRALHALSARLPAGATITSSEYTARLHRRASGSTPVVCVHPGVEPDDYGAPHVHEASSEGLLGTVGRLQRWKRIELALAALPPVLEVQPGTRMRVIGDATPTLDAGYPNELSEWARRLGVAGDVEFVGHVDDVPAAMRELDVLVHTAEREPFGLVLVEAMLAGVPVVAPNDGGPPEIVRDGLDGLLVDVTDARALADAILGLLRDPARRRSLGAAGRARALERFSAARMAAEAWAVAADVAAGRRVHSRGAPDLG